MPILNGNANANRMHRLKGRSARSCSVGTKLTPEEEAKILAAAEAEGKVPSEWVREKLLECAVPGGGSASMLTHIFTDVVGLQMLLMNVLAPFVAGEQVSKERVAQIFGEIQRSKAQNAREILARRAQKAEKAS
jgi:hypothetical protein